MGCHWRCELSPFVLNNVYIIRMYVLLLSSVFTFKCVYMYIGVLWSPLLQFQFLLLSLFSAYSVIDGERTMFILIFDMIDCITIKTVLDNPVQLHTISL